MSATRPRPRGVIFDLDGTLVDSFADIAAALNRTRARFDLPALPLEAVRAKVGSGSEYLVRELVPLPPAQAEAALQHYLASYEETALQETRVYPGALEVLEHFRGRPLAVVTNKPLHIARRVLQGLDLWERFRMVLGGDSLARRKPDPLPVRHVLACFALPAGRALLIGDGVHDVRAGRAAGVPIVAVTTGVEPRAVLEAERPTHVIDSLDELLTLYA
ncbi:MAG TPA: HAD-IA family hydrolase [bacterium]|nr:HAD-IA family hydrolase [bacterium]